MNTRLVTDSLAGRRVIGVDVSAQEEALRFRCEDGGAVVWDTEGDCCSESWWADATGLEAIRGGTVSGVEELDLPDPDDDRSRQEVDAAYGFDVRTDKGVATFVFRNSSNGYYGGWCFVGQDGQDYEWHELTGGEWRA